MSLIFDGFKDKHAHIDVHAGGGYVLYAEGADRVFGPSSRRLCAGALDAGAKYVTWTGAAMLREFQTGK